MNTYLKDNETAFKYDIIFFFVTAIVFSLLPLLDTFILQVLEFINDLFANLQLQFNHFILSNS
jgi:hypothetical protein